jgi:CcmD family protein
MENAGFLYAAYTIIWLVLFGYLFFLAGKQRKLRQDIESLKESLKGKQSQ